jgi:hypothetical protein
MLKNTSLNAMVRLRKRNALNENLSPKTQWQRRNAYGTILIKKEQLFT